MCGIGFGCIILDKFLSGEHVGLVFLCFCFCFINFSFYLE